MRKAVWLAGCLAMGGAAAAAAPSVITLPDWEQKPTGADLAAAYPPDALKAGLGGRATIACVTTAAGLLDDCRVVAEDPEDAGFGDAALELATRFKMKPMTKDGHPVDGGRVRIPIVFKPPATPAEPPTDVAPLDHFKWVQTPTGYDVARAYPFPPANRNFKASAVLACTVEAQGKLTDCQALKEQPAGFGIGRAALSLAPKFRLVPIDGKGGAKVQIPINFEVSEPRYP